MMENFIGFVLGICIVVMLGLGLGSIIVFSLGERLFSRTDLCKRGLAEFQINPTNGVKTFVLYDFSKPKED